MSCCLRRVVDLNPCASLLAAKRGPDPTSLALRPDVHSWPEADSCGRVCRGQPVGVSELSVQATGYANLDAVLPARGWPAHALTEILLPADGVGEIALV